MWFMTFDLVPKLEPESADYSVLLALALAKMFRLVTLKTARSAKYEI